MIVGRRPLVEDDLRWKMTFGGRRPSVKDDLWWKTPLVEDDRRWKMTFSGRRPLLEDDLEWILACCLLGFVAFFLVAFGIFW